MTANHAIRTNRSEQLIVDFYDEFSVKLLGDYVRGNPRVTKAVARVCECISSTATSILDVGCGIGSSSAAYLSHKPWVSVHGVDISPRCIEIAEKLFGTQQLTFSVSNMEFPPNAETFDLISMIDVYEHFPRDNRPQIHRALVKALAKNGILVLTVPSQMHQDYLARCQPEGLQIIDETIVIEDIIKLAQDLNATIKHYEMVSVWNTNDYVHVILERNPTFEPPRQIVSSNIPLLRRLCSKLSNHFARSPDMVEERRQHVYNTLGVYVK